jgi:hypothetical protein
MSARSMAMLLPPLAGFRRPVLVMVTRASSAPDADRHHRAIKK